MPQAVAIDEPRAAAVPDALLKVIVESAALLSIAVGFVTMALCRDRASGRRGFLTGADPVELPDGL